jgi:AcrR family transcriptional regulator
MPRKGTATHQKPPSEKRRNTAEKLTAAVGQVLCTKGAAGLGVNAVAAEAGVDKALIYRYFGGFAELVTAYGETEDFWPSLDELLGSDPAALRELSMADIASTLLGRYADALRKRPVTLDLLAWECVKRTPLTEALEAVRERRSEELFSALAAAGVPVSSRIRSAAVLFSAALQYLAVRGRDLSIYAGMNIRDDEGWQQIFADIKDIFEAL